MKQTRGRGGRRAWRGPVAMTIVLLLASIAGAADPVVGPDSVDGGAAVTVATTKGETIKGTIKSCTPELLVVQPTPRPTPKVRPGGKAPPEPPTPDAVELPWASVRTVSNGLSSRLAFEAWMAKQVADTLCPTCRGERTVWCPTCKGTNHDPAGRGSCPTCKGELMVACKTAGEIGGRVPCPNACLKRNVGNWGKQADGQMARSWKFGTATQWYTEHHVGDVMQVDAKAGHVNDLGKCPICGGTTLVDDPACRGTGKLPCPECAGRKTAPACPNHCDAGRVKCPTCGGTGLRKA